MSHPPTATTTHQGVNYGLAFHLANLATGRTRTHSHCRMVVLSYKGVYMNDDYLVQPSQSKRSQMMTVTIKGITKVAIENPINQIRQAFTVIPDSFNRKVNEQTNRKVITNIPTQLLGNRVMSCEVTFSQGENTITVDLLDFMPAREVESGVLNKGLAGNVYSDYRTGNLPDDRIGLREFWSVLSYFTGCMLTGMLPTPVKPSGQSTIMSHFIKSWLGDNGLQVDSVAITGKNDSRMVYTGDDFTNVYNAFQSNATRILETWADRQGKGGSKSGQINWV